MQHSVPKMAYCNSYANHQWLVSQPTFWPDSGPGWGNSTVTVGASSDSSRSSSIGFPIELTNTNPSSHIVGSHSQQIAANMPSVVGSACFLNPSEALATTYLPTAIDDSYYFYFGDTMGCDVGAIPSSSVASLGNTFGDHEIKYEILPEYKKEETFGRKKTSRRTLQNRLAQRAFRERQAKVQEELHDQITRLKTQYKDLENMYLQLREHHERCGQVIGSIRDISRQLS